jgi:rhodanese-related sulfurtransferase
MAQSDQPDQFMKSFLPQSGKAVGISSGDALKACLMGAVILDIREEDFTLYKQFQVPHVLLMPLSNAMQHIDKLPDDQWLIVADAAGNLAGDFAKMLILSGLQKVCVLSGGIVDWERAGLPVTTDQSQILSGSCVCQLKKRNSNQ